MDTLKVYLVRSKEISCSRFAQIVDIVSKRTFPVKFIAREEDITVENEQEEIIDEQFTPQILKWETLFGYCEEFRAVNEKVEKDDYVIFLTDHSNERNWFSSMDPLGAYNFFISTYGWSDFLDSEACYPIAYELATIPLMIETCGSLDKVEEMAHREPPEGDGPRGCPWDYCKLKSYVQLRLRTGDICPDCRRIMIEKKVDPALIRQIFEIMDNIREQMLFKRRFEIIRKPSGLEVNKFGKKLFFTEMGITVHFNARQMAFYLFFLNHPEGVEFRHLPGNHEREIKDFYKFVCSESILARIDGTVYNMITKEKSVMVTKINEIITDAVGKKIAEYYIIDRKPKLIKDGKKSLEHLHYIKLDRILVKYPSAR